METGGTRLQVFYQGDIALPQLLLVTAEYIFIVVNTKIKQLKKKTGYQTMPKINATHLDWFLFLPLGEQVVRLRLDDLVFCDDLHLETCDLRQ